MRTHIAKMLAFQLVQEDQAPSVFSEIEVVENDGPEDSVVYATYHEGYQVVRLTFNALEEDE